MPGLFDTLNLGTRAMQAQQAGVTISGQNLANANNPAYSRQRVDFQTSDAVSTPSGVFGTGVQIAGVQQIRDSLLDAQIRDENSVGGFWTSSQGALENAQTQLGQFLDTSSTDGTSIGGLAGQLNGLFSSFQGLESDASSMTQRQAIITQAQNLAGSFNQISTRLSAVNRTLNSSIGDDVTSANQLLSDIAQLNADITRTELSTQGTANDLRDLRQQKLESLAQLTNLQTSTGTDGSLSISIGGVTMVSGGKLSDTLQTYDPGNGQLQLRAAIAGTSLSLTGGSLAGAIQTRDGALADLRNGIDSLASELITQVNSVYSAGYDLHGNTGASFFTGTNAATIGVNASLRDPSLLQAAGAPGAPLDNTVVTALANLGQQPDAALGDQNFTVAYASMVAALGNSLANANDQVASQSSVESMLSNQRDSVSGVSMEEELTNLMMFQKAYQASAQIISTVNLMLQTVVTMKSS
jgi:flagellar hook-associated protein 1 FlgK